MKHILLLVIPALLLGSCKIVQPDDQEDPDDCGPTKTVSLTKTIRPGLTNGQYEFYELESPEARNDCHATYRFNFCYADSMKRILDNSTPALLGLDQAFGPGAEFSYFPHPLAAFKSDAFITLANGRTLEGCWSINFSAGNKNTTLPTTRYYVGVRIDENAGPMDSIRISCEIDYYDKPKP